MITNERKYIQAHMAMGDAKDAELMLRLAEIKAYDAETESQQRLPAAVDAMEPKHWRVHR